LERHLRLFPEYLLYEAWEQAQHVTLYRQIYEAAQTPFDFSAAPSAPTPLPSQSAPAFQAAERPEEYRVIRPVTFDEVFEFVRQELEKRFFREDIFTSPESARRYLVTQLAREESEVFAALFLDNRHRLIAFEKLFYGSIDGCSVHPREVVKRTLHHNAAALIFSHNHPSGEPEPSAADRSLTDRLKAALENIDVRVLDHIIVGGAETVSFSERGIL
jgi:DNA repair protein RadC